MMITHTAAIFTFMVFHSDPGYCSLATESTMLPAYQSNVRVFAKGGTELTPPRLQPGGAFAHVKVNLAHDHGKPWQPKSVDEAAFAV